MRLTDIEHNAIKRISPRADIRKRVGDTASMIMGRLEEASVQFPEIVDIALGGSYAKDTWLDGADVDMFMHFTAETPPERFEDIGRSVGFDALRDFDPYVRYSEHPYVEAHVRGNKVNIVPCYQVRKGAWKSAADRSRFHTTFMQENLTEAQRGQVRLLKQFLRTAGLYGAEISVQGFSGYVAEVLVYSLGSFAGVADRFSSITKGTVIGKAGRHFDTPVVIMDPIDDRRNLAAAISAANVSRFILRCRAYLGAPSSKFFANPVTVQAGLPPHLITVRFKYSPRGPDTIWGQVKRAATVVSARLQDAGFVVLREAGVTDENGVAVIAFLLQAHDIQRQYVQAGPEVWNRTACEGFIAKRRNADMWIGRDGRLMSQERREFSNCMKFLRHLLGAGLDSSGMPPGIKADMAAGVVVSSGGRGLPVRLKEGLGARVAADAKILS